MVKTYPKTERGFNFLPRVNANSYDERTKFSDVNKILPHTKSNSLTTGYVI